MDHNATQSGAIAVRMPAIIAVLAVVAFGCDTRSTRIASYDDCVLEYSKRVTNSAVLDTIKVSCKQKHPKSFDFVAIARSANSPDWSEVAAMKEIRTLSADQKEGARSQYFADIILSRVHPDFIAEARAQFDSYVRGVEKQVASAVPEKSDLSAKAPSAIARPQPDLPPKPVALALPLNGQRFTYSSQQWVAPLSIVTRDASRHFFVKLEEWDTGRTVIGFFVHAGQSAETKVPIGTFRLKYAINTEWYGDKELFGVDTTFHEADKRFDFVRSDSDVSGYTVELFLQPHGNLKTSRIDRTKW